MKVIRLYSPTKIGKIGKTEEGEPFIDIECERVQVSEK